ncbi:hypothetical protein KQI84_15420 [bacterium]|nr:hypothetical protein [bacterium]
MAGQHLEKQRRYCLDFLALALAPWTILLQGHQFGLGNHYPTLVFMRRYLNAEYLSGDWMLSTPAIHPLWTHLLANLSQFTGESGALLIAHLVTRVLLLMGIWRLVFALVLRAGIIAGGVAMALAIFEPRLHVGSHYLQGGHWEAAFLGMAFGVWILAQGIHFWADGKHAVPLAIAGGLGVLSHLFINLPLIILVCIGAILVRKDWRSPSLVLAAALLISIPSWGPAAMAFLFPAASPLSSQEVIQILQFRHPHHHQPWTWPVLDFVSALFLIGGGLFVAWRYTTRDSAANRMFLPMVFLGCYVIACAAFWIAGRFQVLAVIAYFQPFRLTSLFFAFVVAGAGLAVESALRRYPLPLVILTSVVAAGVCRFAGPIGPILSVLILVYFAIQLTRQQPGEQPGILHTNRLLAISAIVLVLGFAGVLTLEWIPAARAIPNRFRSTHWLTETKPLSAGRQDLANWIRENTEPGSLFAIPPDMGYFRLWEERPVIVDMKVVPYENSDLAEWAERLREVGAGDPFSSLIPPSEDPSLEELMSAARTYEADFVVLRSGNHNGDHAFTNSQYTILRVP